MINVYKPNINHSLKFLFLIILVEFLRCVPVVGALSRIQIYCRIILTSNFGVFYRTHDIIDPCVIIRGSETVHISWRDVKLLLSGGCSSGLGDLRILVNCGGVILDSSILLLLLEGTPRGIEIVTSTRKHT